MSAATDTDGVTSAGALPGFSPRQIISVGAIIAAIVIAMMFDWARIWPEAAILPIMSVHPLP